MKSIRIRLSHQPLLLSVALSFIASPLLAEDEGSKPETSAPTLKAAPEKPASASAPAAAVASPPAKDVPSSSTATENVELPSTTKANTSPSALPEDRKAKRVKRKSRRELRLTIRESQTARKEAMKHYHAARVKFDAARDSIKADGQLSEAEKEVAKAAQEELREARKELRTADRKTLIARAKTLSPEKRQELKKKLEVKSKARKATRADRAAKKRASIKKALSQGVNKNTLRNELTRHAWRVARLERIIILAETADRTRLLEKANRLLYKESQVHQRRLKRINEGKSPSTAEAKLENKVTANAVAPSAPSNETEKVSPAPAPAEKVETP
jgi:hypothetical protein